MKEGCDVIEKKIIAELKRAQKPVSSFELQQKLGVSPGMLSKALNNLYRSGIVNRVYTPLYDPTRPFDTVSWQLKIKGEAESEQEKVKEALLKDFRLVMAVPISLYAKRAEILNKYGAVDFFDAYTYVIDSAEIELKIICPVVDAYGIFPIVNKITRSPNLTVRIITEMDKSRDLEYISDIVEPDRLVILDAHEATEVRSGLKRKMKGVHMKMIIADDKIALIGSFNFSKYHYLVNFDIGFLIYNDNVVKILSQIFEEIWTDVNNP